LNYYLLHNSAIFVIFEEIRENPLV